MARSVSEIKRQMTDAFMADADIREKYGFNEGDRFDDKFSSVSLENILFFIVAAALYVMETMMDAFRADVDETVRTAVVASVPWYHEIALAFQDGDELKFDEVTQTYKYEQQDEAKRIVKFASVRDMGSSVQMLVSKEKDGVPEMLSDDELARFKAYMQRVKVVGVILGIKSSPSDEIKISVKVKVDRLLYNRDGSLVSDSGKKPVEDAIRNYLQTIIYGGTFNKTKLVDAVQMAQGVKDVELGECSVGGTVITGNNYESVGGSFTLSDESEVTYDL